MYIMASNHQHIASAASTQSNKKADYTKSPYVVKKTAEAKETLTKFPPPTNIRTSNK